MWCGNQVGFVTAAEAQSRLVTLARSMGIDNQDQLVILSDGARWINKS